MKLLEKKDLYLINGGDKDDYDFGYKIGYAAKKAWNWTSAKVKGEIDYFRG
ncbi:hypothetical protein ANHYDRO_01299 [Anaerococcus hydrogenalis DSM 7454]|uniref:Uncharacterized protein n=1 Tax=Anaerococcus hydrogenalis DSM 7454 TaxID=561177 RepID=B6W9P4_9FIRM|nr:hypothetical protein [Anaerococcus hydrogenalis]EEB35863.1 hypothetical protein ANHYDRO_01299 [Anaerococcus hydrogenalis DSM 7454]